MGGHLTAAGLLFFKKARGGGVRRPGRQRRPGTWPRTPDSDAHLRRTTRLGRRPRPRRVGDGAAAAALSYVDGAVVAGSAAGFPRATRAPGAVPPRTARGGPRGVGGGHR